MACRRRRRRRRRRLRCRCHLYGMAFEAWPGEEEVIRMFQELAVFSLACATLVEVLVDAGA